MSVSQMERNGVCSILPVIGPLYKVVGQASHFYGKNYKEGSFKVLDICLDDFLIELKVRRIE